MAYQGSFLYVCIKSVFAETSFIMYVYHYYISTVWSYQGGGGGGGGGWIWHYQRYVLHYLIL